MKRFNFILLLLFLSAEVLSQGIADSIREDEIRKTLTYLSADSMGGRVNHTVRQLEVTRFLYQEFEKYGLKNYPALDDYLHSFSSGEFTPGKSNTISWQSQSTGAIVEVNTQRLYNVVGVLPGKTKPGEVVIFSAHYDHIESRETGDLGLYNGANDNASGTAAVLALAKYFSMRGDNERTLVFCLFAGEELGLLGSKTFVNLVNADSVVAVVNIEMIGLHSAVGKNAFFVTGSWHSTLYKILKETLKQEGSKVRVISRGDPSRLYERSDNYPFALRGIPAHSIMSSDDKDPCYHMPCDDVKYIRTANMTTIVQAIAIGCRTIISGVDRPERK